MKKIPTILPKNPDNLGLVLPDKIDLDLLNKIDHFQVKIDGTACMIKNGVPYCRYDLKKLKRKGGKIVKEFSMEELLSKLPEGAIPCQEPDPISGHFPHWIPVSENNSAHKYILEGFNNLKEKNDGTYECVGPKIGDNPHNEDSHIWIPHSHKNLKVDFKLGTIPYLSFKEFLRDFPFEGLVAYDKEGVPFAKIRRSDFGFPKIKYNKATSLFNQEG